MELYVKVSFWIGVVAVSLHLVVISLADFPTTTKTTLGGQLVKMIISSAFLVWASYLLYWQ